MADSFHGISTFLVMGPDIPDDTTASVTERLIPGAFGTSYTYVDIGGVQLHKLTLRLFFALGSDYTTFQAQVGIQATLIYQEYLSGITCVLDGLRRTSRGLGANAETMAEATFRVVA